MGTALLLQQLLKSAEPASSSAPQLRDVPPPTLIRSDEHGAEWILSLRSEQMATLASEGLSLREIVKRFGITRSGVKSGLWRARHANRPESSGRDSGTPSSAPPSVANLYQEHQRLLSSRAQSPASFIDQPTDPQPFQGTEQGGPR